LNKIVLTTWANKNYTLYWDGKPAPSDDWNHTQTNANWWTTDIIGVKQHMPFQNGDIAIFNDEAKAKTVEVSDGGVVVYAMTVTTAASAVYIFNGGGIEGDPVSWNSSSGGQPPPTISSRLLVEPGATAIFNNKIDFPEIEVQGTAAFNSAVKTAAGEALKATGAGYMQLGNSGSFDGVSGIVLDGAKTTLDFNRTTAGYTYAGTISGGGKVVKTGGATVILSGQNTYSGETKISAGRLKITGLLGADNNGNYGGEILNNGVLEFDQTQAQTLSGRMDGSGALVKSGDGKLTLTHAENRYTGNIYITGGEMEAAGRLGAVYETFDGGTPQAATYVSGYYTGDIAVSQGAKLVFSFGGDYQVLAGKLTGGGTLEKAGAMPLYFTGDAGAWAGTTLVNGGSFHLGASGSYGSTTESGSFIVAGGATLHAGGGGKIITNKMRLAAGAAFVSNPGTFVIRAESAENIEISGGAEFIFRLGENDADTDAAPRAKVAFEDAAGAGAGVLLTAPVSLKLQPCGYMPQPALDGHFTLFSGLDVNSIAASHGGSHEAALLAIFGDKELKIMESRFKLYFTADGRLILEQESYTSIPEPPTYGFFGGALFGVLVLLRRRTRTGGQTVRRRRSTEID
jgi:autotransporter-associated beta strand protein